MTLTAINLAEYVAEAMLALHPGVRNTCIESTRLLVEACKILEIPARAQAVDVRVFNLEAWTLHGMGVPIEQWPHTAHSVGTGAGRQPVTGWDAHLVAVVREEGQRRLVDASASQFERPGKIEVAEVVGMSIPGLWTPQDPLYRVFQNSTVIEYRPLAPQDPRQAEWREADAYTGGVGSSQEAAQFVVDRALRAAA